MTRTPASMPRPSRSGSMASVLLWTHAEEERGPHLGDHRNEIRQRRTARLLQQEIAVWPAAFTWRCDAVWLRRQRANWCGRLSSDSLFQQLFQRPRIPETGGRPGNGPGRYLQGL